MLRRPRLRWIKPSEPLPSAESALLDPNGLVAAGSDLSATRLLEAYQKGIFPWYSDGQPVLWWSPDPRMVLFLHEFKLKRSLEKKMRQMLREQRWQIRLDTAFESVMRACAEPRAGQAGTWITDDIVAAYCELHTRGHAHSIEVFEQGELVGGLYGVAIGRMFYGESMFARRADASKTALATLVATLRPLGFHMVDCQQDTAHLASLGARVVPRAEFLQRLEQMTALPAPPWKHLRPVLPDLVS